MGSYFDSLKERTDLIVSDVRSMLTKMSPTEALDAITERLIDSKTEPGDVDAYFPVFECLREAGLSVEDMKLWIANHPDEYLYDDIVTARPIWQRHWRDIGLNPAEYVDIWLEEYWPDLKDMCIDVTDCAGELPGYIPPEKALNTFSISELLRKPMVFEDIANFDSEGSHELAKRIVQECGYPDDASDNLACAYSILIRTGEIDVGAFKRMVESSPNIDDESRECYCNDICRYSDTK